MKMSSTETFKVTKWTKMKIISKAGIEILQSIVSIYNHNRPNIKKLFGIYVYNIN